MSKLCAWAVIDKSVVRVTATMRNRFIERLRLSKQMATETRDGYNEYTLAEGQASIKAGE
jgi:hypothetical protein